MSVTATTGPHSSGLLHRLLRREAWALALIVSILPNLLFLVSLPFFVAARPFSPGLYLFAGLLSLLLPPAAAYVLFLLAAAADFALLVAITFHLPFGTAIESVRHLASIDPAASGFYVLVVALFVANALLAAWLLNRCRGFVGRASPLLAACFAIAIPVGEWQVNKAYLKQPAPFFESAASLNGITADRIAAGGRNLFIVLVEGMGSYADPAQRSLLGGKLAALTAGGRYELTSGISNFEGSTTGAESRELCGRWGDFTDFMAARPFDCLPRQLAGRGYETISYHGFSHSMFSREAWYPRIGFTETHFMEDLATNREAFPDRCGSVFQGLCDKAVAQAVRDRLKAGPSAPKMLYWLTLNSHIPYVPVKNPTLGCGTPEAAIANRRVCELTEIWGEVFDAVVAIAGDPDLPPTDILVVGDHSTPLWERPAAAHFVPGKVDWYMLKARRPAVALRATSQP